MAYARVHDEEDTIEFTTKDTKSTKLKKKFETFVAFVPSW
jgi:hypothetical protein